VWILPDDLAVRAVLGRPPRGAAAERATTNTAADMKTLEWRLFARGTGEPVNVGDTVTSRHGKTGKVTAVEPPVWPDFVGKVRVDSGDIAYFVEVFDLEFRQI
jgi:hypothetical protein